MKLTIIINDKVILDSYVKSYYILYLASQERMYIHMFKIGDFSKLTNLSVRTLHHYESLGVLLPHHIDPENSYRYYSATQLERVNQIKMLQGHNLF